MATFATYIPFSEINGGNASTLDDFHTAVKAFPRIRLLHICSAMNALLRSETEPVDKLSHDLLVRELFDPRTAAYLLAPRDEVRFVFHRQQILFMAKTAITHCVDDMGTIDQAQLPQVGRVFLMAGDHLPSLVARPEPLDEKFAFMTAQLLPVQEASGFHRFDHKMARSYTMLSRSAPQLRDHGRFWDIPVLFEAITGLPLPTFQALLVGALARFREIDPRAYAQDPGRYGLHRNWFGSTKIPPSLVELFLNYVSDTPNGFNEAFNKANWGNSDFTPFRDKPLFRDGDSLFLIDFAFLAEKFEAGPFWTVHHSLQTTAERGDLHSFWGHVFERYGCDILRSECKPAVNVFSEAPNFVDQTKGQVCDAIVVCGTSAAFIEFKGSTFSSKAKYASDYHLLMSELDGKLVQESDGTPKAVHQLRRAIELAFDKHSPEAVDGIDLRLIDTVFPVIVTRDDVGSVFAINGYLQLKFDLAINRPGVGVRVTPVFCLNSEDFERLSAYFTDTPVTELLHAHYRACRVRGDYLLTSYFATSGNRILQRLGLRRPEMSIRSWRELTTRSAEHLGLEQPKESEARNNATRT